MGQFQQSIGDAVKILVNAHQSNLEKKAHDDEMQQRKDQMDQQQAQFDAQQKANEKIYDLKHAELEANQAQTDYANAQTFQRTNIAPPNTQVVPGLGQTPGVQPTNVQLSPYNPNSPMMQPQQMSTSQAPSPPLVMSGLENSTLVSPRGNVNTVPPLASSPEQRLIQQQTVEQQAEKLREFSRATQAKVEEAQTTMANNLILLGKENENAKERQDNTQKGQLALENLRGQFQLQTARIRSVSALKDMEDEVNPDVLHGGAIGAISQEDMRAKYGTKAASIYNSQAAEQGYQFLPKAKVDQLDKISQMAQVLPKIESMITTQAMNPWEVNNPMSDVGKKYQGLRDEVRAAAPSASVALTGVRRFSQPELERFDDYFLPNKNPLTSGVDANLGKYNSFQNDLRTAVQNVTKGVGPKQKQAINDYLKSMGFNPEGKLESQQPRPSGTKTNQDPINSWQLNPKTGNLELHTGGQ